MNKPAKDYLKRQFDQWYSEQVLAQLEGEDIISLESLDLQPINLSLASLKEVGAKWLVDMATYISNNPQMIANGFIHSGITGALDGKETDNVQRAEDVEIEVDSGDDLDEFEDNCGDLFDEFEEDLRH